MRKKKNANVFPPCGIVLYAKKSGLTSFSSLWSVKKSLNTEKVGHTGTLDSFADGLLVVLTGSLTHLVPHITRFTKTYKAVVCFGKETDTLDPTGKIIKEGFVPSKEQIESALPQFRGAILQVPPEFSALHVNGKRASDLVREGKEVRLEERQLFIYKNELVDYRDGYALMEITCSKGTYIRALARDIAKSIGTCAHLVALRRTQVGPFYLDDAACADELPEFTIENAISRKSFHEEKPKAKPSELSKIREKFIMFSPEVAFKCGFESDIIKKEAEKSYLNGRPLSMKMFSPVSHEHIENEIFSQSEIAVFYDDVFFAGMIQKNPDKKLSYGFVVRPMQREFSVFTWENIKDGMFPVQYVKKGTSLTVGSFEAVHQGHQQLMDIVKAKKDLVPGIVTFSSSIKNDLREIYTLEKRLSFFREAGLSFAIVIDFKSDFAHLSGKEFFSMLSSSCGLRHLVEGNDFKCGYKGSTDMYELGNISREIGFELQEVSDIVVDSERVSSSRVKDKIVSGDFKAVSRMIARPFAIELAGVKFKKISECSGGDEFAFDVRENQILPKDGSYEVVANFDDKNLLHTTCIVSDKKMSIILPTENYASRILDVVFC